MATNGEISTSGFNKDRAAGSQVPTELPSHEELSQLARDDPQAYETLRRALVENFIDNAPDKYKKRLRGIQFRVDHQRQLSHTALGSTVRIYKLCTGSDCLDTVLQLRQPFAWHKPGEFQRVT